MNKKRIIPILIIGMLAVIAVLGTSAFRSGSSLAAPLQTATPSDPTSDASTDQSTPSTGTRQSRGGDLKGSGGSSNEDLAAALGITVDELSTAYQTANQAALTKAVEAGLITQAQANEMLSKGSTRLLGGHLNSLLSENGIDFRALLADALGITVEQLEAAQLAAYNANLDQAVTDGRLTQEQAELIKGQNALYSSQTFKDAMESAFSEAVKQAVSSGVITQAQADLILENYSNNGSGFGLQGFRPGGRGGSHGFGEHGGGRQLPSATPESTGSSGSDA